MRKGDPAIPPHTPFQVSVGLLADYVEFLDALGFRIAIAPKD